VHNQRIERLWRDLTSAIGNKWRGFFTLLQDYYGLDTHDHIHIWLLHHIFLDQLNDELLQWANVWNCHPIQERGGGNESPQERFYFGMLRCGLRGFPAGLDLEEETGRLDMYGVEGILSDQEDEEEEGVQFDVGLPHVPQGWLEALDGQLQDVGGTGVADQASKIVLWQTGLAFVQANLDMDHMT
jgi:hypothetical protein